MAKLYYQGHGSYRIIAADGRVIYVDPFAGNGYEPSADIVLVTHQHGDHNELSLITHKPGCQVITNEEALAGGRHNRFEFDGIIVQAVMAKNLMHNPKKCVGYLMYLDGIKIYASGDTSKTEQMKDFAALELDYALFCCDGIYNMGLKESSGCAALIGARHNIPIHIAPGKLFDKKRAAWWERNAPNPMVIEPGSETELLSAQDEAYTGAYMNEKVLGYVYSCRDELQVTTKEGAYVLTRKELGRLTLPTGRIVANDPCVFFETDEFTTTAKPGSYSVFIFIARSENDDRRVALAMIGLSHKKAVKWEMALVQDQKIDELKDNGYYGYGVDSGTGGFMDKQTAERISERGLDVYELFQAQFDGTYVHTYSYAIGGIDGGANDVAAFSSGWGDGCYPSYFGFDEDGEPCALVTDFFVLD